MERTAFLQADYLDILFDHRNKNYGSYELRKHYSERALKATMITLSAIMVLLLAYAIKDKFKTHTTATLPPLTHTILTDIKLEQPKPKLQLPATPPPAAAPTKIFVPPLIVHNDEVVTTPPTVDDMKHYTPGVTNNPGDPGGLDPGLVHTNEPGTGIVPTTEPTKQPIPTYVEQMPEFDGDLSAYLGAHIRYPQMAKENNIEGRVNIKFVVNEDGSIAAAEVTRGIGGGCDQEALRVLNSMPKWKPGKQNGRPVKVYLTLPIIFKLG